MENYSDNLKLISLSGNAVQRHTENIAEDLKKTSTRTNHPFQKVCSTIG